MQASIRLLGAVCVGVVVAGLASTGPAMADGATPIGAGMAGGLEPPIDGALEPPAMVWRLVPADQSPTGNGAPASDLPGGGGAMGVPATVPDSTPSQAATPGAVEDRLEAAIKSSPVITDKCVMRAAKRYNVPLDIMLGIMKTEGGSVGSASGNTDGSYDLGPMQVNDNTWVPVLARQELGADTPAREKFIEAMLRYNACYNINMGFYIYSQYLREAGGDYMRAVGYYNSHDPVAMRTYQANFTRNFAELFGNQLN